ncbi:hypothetical protein C2857_006974 [Epichloe festucae Fl1]|uniref:Major facilitator superfamily (MFS) profile domain-containing protein n=1 Tax=Epichloe festucae (strain Fl1) TaxID=877507 RepID=A0A7S9PSQ2_EPIFF|nr:hypothetical protein C2857_006974 [Epichloe festucae Fl1]
MGKGFAISPSIDLGVRLRDAYAKHRGTNLPPVYVAAIANDSVSTLVSFIFNYDGVAHRRATMGLILGTGSNATIPVKLSMLHPSKRPRNVNVLPGEKVENAKIAVNTEWSINGTAPPMRDLGLINAWDDKLSAQNEKPGFQPLEYMTAGRYLGELGRIILLDYLIGTLKVSRNSLPSEMLQQDSLTTTFLSHFKPLDAATLLPMLRKEFPESPESCFAWTEHHAEALYHIAKAIEVRAAGIIAAAILALLTIGGELPAEEEEDASMASPDMRELGVGYTGGCVVHFQDYLSDCQAFIDGLVRRSPGYHVQDEDGPDFDMLSRSVPPTGPLLEPEPADLAMLRPFTSNASLESRHRDRGRYGEQGIAASRRNASERSPLLRPRGSSTASNLSTCSHSTDGEPPLFLNGIPRGRFWFIFSQILMVQFIGCFDGTIMASSHPVITSYFGAANSASWLSTAFLLTSTAFQPLLGRLSDAIGRKPLFLGTISVFTAATLCCALANSIESFIVARAFCGLGAGGAMSLGSIITSDLVPIERRGSYQSYMNMVYGVGSALGAAVGGAMAEALGWRWEFGVQIPPMVICLCISAVAIPDGLGIQGERKSVVQAIREFDAKGSVLLTVSVSFLILGLNLGGNVFPSVLLMSATDSGLRLVMPTLFTSMTGALTGFGISWTRRLKWPLVCGTTSNLVGTICLALLRRDLPPLAFFLTLLASSISNGFQFPGTFMAILASSPQSEQAVVSSTLILWRSVGMVLGVAVSSLILQNALVFYLDDFVQGELKDVVIAKVRSSVEAVAKLDDPYREQVIRGYEAALRLTFGFCVLVAAASLLIIVPVKLNMLPSRKSKRHQGPK